MGDQPRVSNHKLTDSAALRSSHQTMKTIECSLAQLRPDLGQQIAAHLHGDEKLLACCETSHVEFQGGLPTFAYVITPRQIIQAWTSPKARKTGAYSIPLSNVLRVGIGANRKAGFEVWLRTRDDASMRLYFETEPIATRFADTLRAAIEHANAAVPQNAPSPADRLRELTQLRQDGLITADEFEQRRKEILGQL